MNEHEPEEPGGDRPASARDWDDRWIDVSLRELRGQRPPDLSQRVLLALHEQAPLPLPQLSRRRALTPRLAALLSVLLCFCLVMAWLGWFGGPAEPERVAEATIDAQIEIDVLVGDVECVDVRPGRATARCAAGARIQFAAQPGNRLRSDSFAVARVGPFGVFAAGPRLEMEVRAMEFTKARGVMVASTLTLAVVAGTVTWHTLTRSEAAAAGETLRLTADPGGAAGAAALSVENERLRQRVLELEQQHDALLTEASRRPAPITPPEAPAAEEPPPPPPPEAAVLFTDDKFAAGLAAIDWKLVGGVTHAMGPLIAELVAKMAEGGEMPMELAIKVSQLNMKLVEQVPLMMKAGLPGFGPNGTYTHPLVTANSMASTLDAAGMPLSPGQRATFDGLVRAYSAESQAIADATREFDLEHLLAESEMKDRMYSQFRSMLQPGQEGIIYPEGAGGYDGNSLFDSGLLTQVHARPVPSKNAAEFADKTSGKIADQLGLDQATARKVQAVLEQQLASAPGLWADRATGVETSELQMMKTGRTRVALQHQLEWMRAIQREVPLTAEQRKKLLACKSVFVPLAH